MKKTKRSLAGIAVLGVSALLLSGCSAGAGEADSDTLKLWHFESDTSAMGIAWEEAIKVF